MFKATMDGTGIVVYSTEPEGEILLEMPELEYDDPAMVAMTLEPSRILKGIFVEKQNWDNMASSERPQFMAEHAPFDMLSIKFLAKEEESILFDYLILKNPSLMLASVEVEYKEIPGTSKPIGFEMLRWQSEWPSSYEVPFFRAATGSLEWQRAIFDVNMARDGEINDCPFKTVLDAKRKDGDIDTTFYSDNSISLRNCVKHVELWDQVRYTHQWGAPWFIISGGVAAVRRISFNFAGAQFWAGLVNSTEFISLFSPPKRAPEVPAGTPGLVVSFEGNAYNWYHPEELQFVGYPSYPPNIFSGLIPWESPFRLVRVVSGPNNTVVNRVVTKYRDDNTADWHFGSNLGKFYFLGNGEWRFSPVAMAWNIPIDETRQSSIDFLIEDEYGEHLCRAVATITGQAELTTPTVLTLRPQYIVVDTKENGGVYDEETACHSGNVFSNAHEATGWTVTLIGWNASHVGTVQGMYGEGGGYAKIDANGDFKLWTNDEIISLDQEEYPPGYVLHGYIEYSAQKGGQTRSAYINLYTTIIEVP